MIAALSLVASLWVAQSPDPLQPAPEQAQKQARAEAAQLATREAIELDVVVEPDTLHLGDRAVVTVTARYPERVRLFFPFSPDIKPFRVLGRLESPETVLMDGKLVSSWKLEVTPLRLGRRKLPPFDIQYENKDAETGTVETPWRRVDVEPRVDPESKEATLAGNDPPLQLLAKNWTLIILLIGLCVVAGTVVLTLFAVRYVAALPRRGPPPPPPLPAHVIAGERLRALRDARLLQLGELKPFTFRVSEILREYLGNRYSQPILEMTSSELIGGMKSLSPQGLSIYELEAFLQSTDLVKFANMTPSHGECEKALQQCEETIRKTRQSDAELAGIRAKEEYRRRLEKPAHPFKRTFAALVDLLLFSLVSAGLCVLARSLDAAWPYWLDGVLFVLFVLLKDAYGAGSPGKVLTGLALTPVDDIRSEALELSSRVVRNLPLLLPLAGQTMELVVMVYAADGRRVGDRWAESRVLDKRPDTPEHVFLLLGVVLLAAVVFVAGILPFVLVGGGG